MSDAYTIRYWFKDGKYWKQFTDAITADGKGEHNKVKEEWKENHKEDKVRLISIRRN